MIDPAELANDVAGNVAVLAFPALLWALLYLLAWEHGAFAESIGFGRRTFWLLLPGALLATLVLLPIAPIANDWLSVSYAGALFPLFVGGLAFARFAPPLRRSLPAYAGLVGIEAVALLVVVIRVPGGPLQLPLVVAIAAAVPLVAGTLGAAAPGRWFAPVTLVLGLTSGVIVATFLASMAIPGVGIEETFPAYLLPPIAAGLLAVALAEWVFPGAEGLAIPVAYVAGTVGVLVGADVLRQPPLYGTGPAGLYAIGGAGVLDLVYLSGLLAFAAAYVGHRVIGRGFEPVEAVPAPAPSPVAQLAQALRSGVSGQISESLRASASGSHAAADQARQLLAVREPAQDRPWDGLPVPGWVVSDQANLDSAARIGSTDGREGFRGFLTARWLVLIGRDLGARRFATLGSRAAAFALDLVVVTTPAVALWTYLLLTTPGSLASLASSVSFNAAIYAYAGLAFLYFVISESVFGRTPGKWLLGIEVCDRRLGAPTFLASSVRNASKLPTLTVVGLGLAVALLLLFKAGPTSTLPIAGDLGITVSELAFLAVVGFAIGGAGLFGLVGALLIALSTERQRFGDLVAGTWVVREPTPAATGSTAPPPGAVRSE